MVEVELPSAFDIITLIIALIGLFGGLPKIWSWITKPNIEISDLKVYRWPVIKNAPIHDDDGHIIGSEDVEANTVISWRVHNKPRFSIFKKDIHDLKTKYIFSRVDISPLESYQWSHETNIWPMLGCNQDYPQRIEFNKYCIPDGKYILNLNVMSGNSVLYPYRKELDINEKLLRQWRTHARVSEN